MRTFGIALVIILAILGATHGLVYLITKGIIWVAYGLFNVGWHSRFWYVYVLVFILTTIFGSSGYKHKGG